jgi:hypothetical protein
MHDRRMAQLRLMLVGVLAISSSATSISGTLATLRAEMPAPAASAPSASFA